MFFRTSMRRVFNTKTFAYALASTATSIGFYADFRSKQTLEMKQHLFSIFDNMGEDYPSSFDVTKLPEVKPHEMRSGRWQDLEDENKYKVRIAMKPGFEAQLGKKALSHTSLAFEIEEKYLVIGRQSPALRTESKTLKAKDPFHKTLLDNEMDYTMPSVLSNFKILETNAVLTGAEIKSALHETQEKICNKQICDMMNSNCCTAAVDVICNMIKEVNKRKDNEEKTTTLKNLSELLYHASHTNYSQGVSNNGIVRESIKGASEILACSMKKSETLSSTK